MKLFQRARELPELPHLWALPWELVVVSNIFVIFTLIPGEMIQFDGPHIFQVGGKKPPTRIAPNLRNFVTKTMMSCGPFNSTNCDVAKSELKASDSFRCLRDNGIPLFCVFSVLFFHVFHFLKRHSKVHLNKSCRITSYIFTS